MDVTRSTPSSKLPNSGSPNNSASGAATHELRDGLLIRLIFAANRLALARMQVDSVPAHFQSVCRECGAAGVKPVHGARCKTGAVLTIIDQLSALTPSGLGDGEAVRA